MSYPFYSDRTQSLHLAPFFIFIGFGRQNAPFNEIPLNFSVLGSKMRNEYFCDFEQKHTRNHYIYKVLSNFPAGMIFLS